MLSIASDSRATVAVNALAAYLRARTTMPMRMLPAESVFMWIIECAVRGQAAMYCGCRPHASIRRFSANKSHKEGHDPRQSRWRNYA